MPKKVRVGLVGYGKAGNAVADVLCNDSRFELCWIVCRKANNKPEVHPGSHAPIIENDQMSFEELLDRYPVDALVDFSARISLHSYGEEIRRRGIMLVSAISAYTEDDLAFARSLGRDARVLCSPNITLGINFLIVAAKQLRTIAPLADVEILEHHFREKTEVSGTARKIAQSLNVEDKRITSLRLGGIVGHHEVIFGFPHETLSLTHDSIRREAFGTGVAFVLTGMAELDNGFYTFDDLLMYKMRISEHRDQ